MSDNNKLQRSTEEITKELLAVLSQDKVFHEDVLKSAVELIEQGADGNIKNDSGLTPLHISCWLGGEGLTEKLIQLGLNLETSDDARNTPLISACDHLRYGIINQLIKAGANLNAFNNLSLIHI